MKKKMTIEQLARATQEEFGVVSNEFSAVRKEMRDEFAAVRKEMRDGFKKTEDGFKAIANVLDLMRADISDVKIALPPMIRAQAIA